MGSGYTPSGIYGGKLGAMAGILAETDAYADFVGAAVAAEDTDGMFFYGIDRRELDAAGDVFPDAFVIWNWGEDFEKYSTQAGGTAFKFRGTVTLVIEGNTPAEFERDTPAAMNWIMEHAQAMVGEMEDLFGYQGRQEVARHKIAEGPYREHERGGVDYCCVVIEFELRN